MYFFIYQEIREKQRKDIKDSFTLFIDYPASPPYISKHKLYTQIYYYIYTHICKYIVRKYKNNIANSLLISIKAVKIQTKGY